MLKVSSHLYNSTAGRVIWFVKRFGAWEVLFKPLRMIFAPLIIPALRAERFRFKDKEFSCLYARYNMTWIGERMVEIPIIQNEVAGREPEKVLEVGNVLSHYFSVRHRIVDKFETAHGVTNSDILDFSPAAKFDLIVSISTFEHIGFDDDAPSSSSEKILGAIKHCRGLLTPGGRLIITFPTGYNPDLDQLLSEGQLGASAVNCLKRNGKRRWMECSIEDAMKHPYKSVYPYANSLVIAEFSGSPD